MSSAIRHIDPDRLCQRLTVIREGKTTQSTVSMNNVLSIAGYRFYQSGMGDGYTVLSVAHDPWGIGVTYGGYALLLVSMVAFFFSRRSGFRRLLKTLGCIMLMLPSSLSVSAAESDALPSTMQRGLAAVSGSCLSCTTAACVPSALSRAISA